MNKLLNDEFGEKQKQDQILNAYKNQWTFEVQRVNISEKCLSSHSSTIYWLDNSRNKKQKMRIKNKKFQILQKTKRDQKKIKEYKKRLN